MLTKRKQSVLFIQDKLSIILQLEKGEKLMTISSEYGISKQQISDICKNKDKIMKFANNLESNHALKRKSLKVTHDGQLDEALYAWFIQQRTAGTLISGSLLQEKAKHFHSQLHVENANGETFKASTRFFEKFKNCHGIRNLSIQGEKLSAAVETVEPFLQKLRKVIKDEGLTPEQIYNADETRLLWKCLPDRILVACHEKTAQGFKKSKDRLTVFGCTSEHINLNQL